MIAIEAAPEDMSVNQWVTHTLEKSVEHSPIS